MAELVELDVVSASHYDGAAATAEAALMTCRATRRDRVLVSRAVHPHYRADPADLFWRGPRARGDPAGRRMATPPGRPISSRSSGCSPTRTGRWPASSPRSPTSWVCSSRCPRSGSLPMRPARCSWPSIEPVSLAVLAPPGAYGADIAAGEGQPLGIAPQYGGPYLGILASTDALVRQIPGRLVGHDQRPRRPACLRHDHARARAGHPTRQGRQQHLHQPGPAGARRIHLSRDHRATRAARCRRPRRGARRRARERRWRLPGRHGSIRAHTSTSSRCGSPMPGPSTVGSSTAASSPVSCSPTSSRTIRRWPMGSWCARRRSPRRPRSNASPTPSARSLAVARQPRVEAGAGSGRDRRSVAGSVR